MTTRKTSFVSAPTAAPGSDQPASSIVGHLTSRTARTPEKPQVAILERHSRRSILRGIGAGSVLLSGVLRGVRAEAAANNTRAVFFFHANGSHYAWTPMGTGDAFTLTPHIAPLEPVRKDIVILRKLIMQRGGGNAHKAATLSALGAGSPTSFDQVLAEADGVKGTAPLNSLELAIGFTAGGGGKAPSLSQVKGTFLPGERNPVAAYQRIAGRISPAPMAQDPAAAEKALAARKSVLDYLRADADRFRLRLGAEEKPKMDLYFESLREVERGLAAPSALGGGPGCEKTSAPAGMLNYELRMVDMPKASRSVLDLMAVGLACGVTRVMSMMWGGGENQEDIDYTGIRDWHITTHGNPNGAPGEKIIKMQAYLAGEYAYFIQKLKSFGQGPGSPFDNTISIWGTQNGNTNQTNFSKEDHDRHNTPFILSGGGGGLKLGRVLDCNDLMHPDLYLSVARAFGLNLTTVGDPTWCKGPLPGLFT